VNSSLTVPLAITGITTAPFVGFFSSNSSPVTSTQPGSAANKAHRRSSPGSGAGMASRMRAGGLE
jgi:hypothetical protein